MEEVLNLNAGDDLSAGKGEIVVYQPDEVTRLEVKVENETVWLTQEQIAVLFGVNQPAISKHIHNIYKSGELSPEGTYSILEYMGSDGRRKYSVNHNLALLEDRLNHRIVRCESRLDEHQKQIDFFVRTSLPPVEGLFYDGQIFDAYIFVSDLIKSARVCLILIDNYVDESVLLMLAKRGTGVSAEIRTGRLSQQLQLDLTKHNVQYEPISITQVANIHDRFLIVDDTVYHLGASMKDLGKKLFAFSKMSIPAAMLL